MTIDPALNEVPAVAGTLVDSHLAYARSDWLHIVGIGERQSIDPRRNSCPSQPLLQA
jgi:hypothetical protein